MVKSYKNIITPRWQNFKVLYVATEIKPFLNDTYVADIVRKLPQGMQEKGVEIRILVPKFGLINEEKIDYRSCKTIWNEYTNW